MYINLYIWFTLKVQVNNNIEGYYDVYIGNDATGSYNQNRNWSNVVHLNAGDVVKQVLETNNLNGLSSMVIYNKLILTKIG